MARISYSLEWCEIYNKVKNLVEENIPWEIIYKLKMYFGANSTQREEKLRAFQSGYSAVTNLYIWVCPSGSDILDDEATINTLTRAQKNFCRHWSTN